MKDFMTGAICVGLIVLLAISLMDIHQTEQLERELKEQVADVSVQTPSGMIVISTADGLTVNVCVYLHTLPRHSTDVEAAAMAVLQQFIGQISVKHYGLRVWVYSEYPDMPGKFRHRPEAVASYEAEQDKVSYEEITKR